jgi:hypothetical protein
MKASSVPELKGGQMLTLAYFIGIIIVIYIVIKALQQIGLIKSAAQQRADKEKTAAVKMMETDDYFDPHYLKDKVGQFKALGSNVAIVYAKDLRSAMAGLGTDEEAIYATFGKFFNKCNVAEVALYYVSQYNRDLQADLLNELTDSEKTKLMNIVNALPNK